MTRMKSAGGRDRERRASGTRCYHREGGACRFFGDVAVSSTGRLQEREVRRWWNSSLFPLHR